jgi:hypothetical protein
MALMSEFLPACNNWRNSGFSENMVFDSPKDIYSRLSVEANRTKVMGTLHGDQSALNPLTPNDPYRGRTAPLTSKRCILYTYSTNIGTEYFKHGICSSFFLSLFKIQFV